MYGMIAAVDERGGTVSARTKILAGTGLMVLAQFAHLLDVLRYDDTASFPAVLGDPVAIFGIGIAALAFGLTASRHRLGPSVAVAAGGAIAVGFVLTHGIPFQLGGLNNPYWTFDGNRADLLRWASVVVLVVLGAWTAWTAWTVWRSSATPAP
jgi:hypothetical protein